MQRAGGCERLDAKHLRGLTAFARDALLRERVEQRADVILRLGRLGVVGLRRDVVLARVDGVARERLDRERAGDANTGGIDLRLVVERDILRRVAVCDRRQRSALIARYRRPASTPRSASSSS